MPQTNLAANDLAYYGDRAQAILDRHDAPGASEAEIRAAVRDFLIETKLATAASVQMEQSPGEGSSGRVDLRTRDVIFEFKVRIGDRINPTEQNVRQLDDYLKAAIDGGRPQRFGILTDGKYWILRWPGMGVGQHATADRVHPRETLTTDCCCMSGCATRRRRWKHPRHPADGGRDPQPAGRRGRAFDLHLNALRRPLHRASRDHPTIAVKRELWRRLLAAALGQVVEEEPDLDRSLPASHVSLGRRWAGGAVRIWD